MITKEQQREHSRRHYLANKDRVKAQARASNKRHILRNREYVNNYLSTHPCIDCAESDIVVLEFDHVKGEKFKDISQMRSECYSIAKIQEEMNKCEVRCANCHRRVTHQRRIIKE